MPRTRNSGVRMLPAIPLLQRASLRSGMSDALYDPHTLIMRVFAKDPNGLNDADHLREAFEYNASVVHERVHWLQHHGTSMGCFLSALRYSQQRTAARWLRDLPSEDVREMLRQR